MTRRERFRRWRRRGQLRRQAHAAAYQQLGHLCDLDEISLGWSGEAMNTLDCPHAECCERRDLSWDCVFDKQADLVYRQLLEKEGL